MDHASNLEEVLKDVKNRYTNVVVTMQNVEVFDKVINKGEVFKPYIRYNYYEPMDAFSWLVKVLGYYPVWSISVDKLTDTTLPTMTNVLKMDRKYLFVIDTPEKHYKTDFQKWCDIKYYMDNGTVKECNDHVHLYNMNYLEYKEGKATICQTLFETINKENVLEVYINENGRFEKIY